MKNAQEVSKDVQQSDALGRGAYVLERPLALLRLTGKDPVGMLNAILTNEVPGEERLGVYAMLLNPKGRVQADLRVLKHGDAVIVAAEPVGAEAAKEILGRYAPFSRVKLEELSDWSVLGLYGPEADALLGVELAEHATAEANVGGAAVLAAGVASPASGYDLFAPSGTLRDVREYLIEHGASATTSEAHETTRIEVGIPRFGADITPDNFPGETGVLERAVSFAKGCYPGQETVARMHYRGHPNKTLHRFVCEGTSPGAEILQDDKVIGTITSVAPLPSDGKFHALGYLSRKAEPETRMTAGDVPLFLLGPVRG